MRRLSIFLTLIFIFIFQSGFLVIGHRGEPNKFAEETTQSFDAAFADGADYVELDLHVSKDNQLVVSHDRDLKRVTGTSAIVSQNFFNYLTTLKQANGEPIYSLAQIFSYYQNRPQTKFLIETKKTKSNNPKNMEPLLVELIKQYHMEDRVMVHSFSYKSLKAMEQLLPQVPRIFIVGSLKRINFEVLPYISGINISSRLVTPVLIDQLHALNKKVLVWDQMSEDPKQWNWLVNLPIDGVVTNYPAMGHQYAVAKNGTEAIKVNRWAISGSLVPLQILENPYLKVETPANLAPLQKVKVSEAVIVNHIKYYQIGSNQFVEAANLNYDLNPNQITPYLNQTLTIKKPNVATYTEPTAPEIIQAKLTPKTQLKITGVNTNNGKTWFNTTKGWVAATDVLVSGINPLTNDLASQLFFSQNPKQRISNISLQLNPIIPTPPEVPCFIEKLVRF